MNADKLNTKITGVTDKGICFASSVLASAQDPVNNLNIS